MIVSCCNVRLNTKLGCVRTKVRFLADVKTGGSSQQCCDEFNAETSLPLFKDHLNKTVLTRLLVQSNKLCIANYTTE